MASCGIPEEQVGGVKRRRHASDITIRHAVEADITTASRVLYESFKRGSDQSGVFSGVAESPAISRQIVESAVSSQNGFVACNKVSGEIVGFNVIAQDNAPAFYGIGPLAVGINCQQVGVGRMLLLDALDRVNPNGHIRLTVDSYNNQAFALYTKCGFQTKTPLVVIERKGNCTPPGTVTTLLNKKIGIRAMQNIDIEICADLCERIARCPRKTEICDALSGNSGVFGKKPAARIALREGKIVGYTTGLTYSGHTVCEDVEDAIALFADLQSDPALHSDTFRIFFPCAEQPQLLNFCLQNDWKIIKHSLLMAKGPYEAPLSSGVFIPTADG